MASVFVLPGMHQDSHKEAVAYIRGNSGEGYVQGKVPRTYRGLFISQTSCYLRPYQAPRRCSSLWASIQNDGLWSAGIEIENANTHVLAQLSLALFLSRNLAGSAEAHARRRASYPCKREYLTASFGRYALCVRDEGIRIMTCAKSKTYPRVVCAPLPSVDVYLTTSHPRPEYILFLDQAWFRAGG